MYLQKLEAMPTIEEVKREGQRVCRELGEKSVKQHEAVKAMARIKGDSRTLQELCLYPGIGGTFEAVDKLMDE